MTGGLAAWMDQAKTSIQRGARYESVPLDHLLGSAYDRSRAVVEGHREHARLIEATGHWDVLVVVRLMIPLLDAVELDARAPELSAIQTDLHELEPPKLYLCDRDSFLVPSSFEEYRVPIARYPGPDAGTIYVSYTCFRDEQARLSGWEFTRCVWWDYYRPGWPTVHELGQVQ